MEIRTRILIALIIVASGFDGLAQDFGKNKRYWSVGGTVNAINYVGDLDPAANLIAPALRYTRPNFGAVITYRYAPRVSFRGAFTVGWIKGNDRTVQNTTPGTDASFRYLRYAEFSSNIWELKGDVIIDLFENRGRWQKRPDYTPYVFAGLATFYQNPTTNVNGQDISLTNKSTNPENIGISKFQVAVPFGIGFRYKIAKQWDLAFEIGWRKTFTGGLDGVTNVYANPNTLNTTQLDAAYPQKYYVNSDHALAQDLQLHGYFVYNSNTQQMVDYGHTNPAGLSLPAGSYIIPNGYGTTDPNSSVVNSKRGQNLTDWYIVTGFHLTYILQAGVICPKFR